MVQAVLKMMIKGNTESIDFSSNSVLYKNKSLCQSITIDILLLSYKKINW